jgi:GNAT superfamily N-acetyltransferase
MRRDVMFRVATPSEYARVAAAYDMWGYRGGISPEDTLFVAERGSHVVAAVRRTWEHRCVLLRGMYVAPEHQRRGIGGELLEFFVSHLDCVPCYCVPYTHLREFYGRAGFVPLAPQSAPAFLRERVASYRARGLDVLIMRRPSASATNRLNQAMQPTARRRTASLLMINKLSFQTSLASRSSGRSCSR